MNAKARRIDGDIISPGRASGKLCFVDFAIDAIVRKINIPQGQVAGEIEKFETGVRSVVEDLNHRAGKLEKDSFVEEAALVRAHAMMLEDRGFRKKVREEIETNRLPADIAVEHVLQELAVVLEKSEDPVFAQRADDLRDIGLHLRKKLSGADTSVMDRFVEGVSDPVIAVRQLLPSMVLEANSRNIRGFVIQQGSSLSHAAILAKSFGLPVIKVRNLYELGIRDHETVLIDAVTGTLIINPGREEAELATGLPESARRVRKRAGLPVRLWANIVDPAQIDRKCKEETAGIGLYRTEFIFMKERDDFPDEDEQILTYSPLLDKCGDVPVTVRTVDIGGDKILPYFSLGPQENPYLGLRAHRIYRFHPEIFITQVRAILRAAAKTRGLRLLYPMIESLDDLLFVQDLLNQALSSLRKEGLDHSGSFQQGIMVEVPSAVWNLKELSEHVDFMSVGTNDLLQYFFAVDRNTVNVHGPYQIENPVAIRMMKGIVDVAKQSGKSLTICGEIASDLYFIPLLVGLGFEDLSVDLHAMPAVGEFLSSLDVPACRELAQKCLQAESTPEAGALLDAFCLARRGARAQAEQDVPEFVDPVCEMAVRPEDARWRVTKDNKTYYFCSKRCRDRFLG
jgi:phosphoenolpyruvate-protein phosphotransferase